MSRKLLGVAMLGLALSACASTPIGSDKQESSEEATGSVSLPLVTKIGDTGYRLRNATFTITGPALGGRPRVIKPLPDIEVHNEPLPVGSYAITLEKAWILEKRGPADKDYVVVDAKLVTPNPLDFEVTGKAPADALFGFATTSGDVSFTNGSVDVRIGVQDCDLYNSYMASLGTLTANCLGTIDPHAYEIDGEGFLVPTFTKCADGDVRKLRSIRQVLSLQHRTARLPFAKSCIAGRYATSLAKFEATGTSVCPKWQFVRTENPINGDVIAKVAEQLPKLPSSAPLPPGILDGDRPALKTFNLYAVTLDGAPNQRCQGASDCAQVCATTFPGFAVGISKTPDGREAILTDPDSWLETTSYTASTDDPYLRLTFYHPMSYFGGAPGVQFGDPHRAMPCGLDSNNVPICLPESCSYFTGIHRRTRLQLDCNDYADADTCVSYCGAPLPAPPVVPAL